MTKKQKRALAELIALALRDSETHSSRYPENKYAFMAGYYERTMIAVIESLGFKLDDINKTV